VSRTLKALTLAEAQQVVQVLDNRSSLFIACEVNLLVITLTMSTYLAKKAKMWHK
jgi:hypothetical protein